MHTLLGVNKACYSQTNYILQTYTCLGLVDSKTLPRHHPNINEGFYTLGGTFDAIFVQGWEFYKYTLMLNVADICYHYENYISYNPNHTPNYTISFERLFYKNKTECLYSIWLQKTGFCILG